MTRNRVVNPVGVSVVLVMLLHGGAVAAEATSAPDKAGSTQSEDLNRARNSWLKSNKADKVYYHKQFDLSGLPDYVPRQHVKGVIHQWGSNYLADSRLEQLFEAEFHRYQPDVSFDNHLKSTFIAMAGLYAGGGDLAPMGRKATSDELQGYQRIFDGSPLEIAMASGSFDVPGWTFALVPLVNAKNPLTHLTLAQLDGIFGAPRSGGMRGNMWDPSAKRDASANIRTWGQLGLTGEWADKPIHVYGYNLAYHFPQDFAEVVFDGGNKWNENLIEFSNAAKPDGSGLISAGTLLAKAVGDDPYGITYTGINYRLSSTKDLALGMSDRGPFVRDTLETVQDHTYPLARHVFYYVKQQPGQPIDPVTKEFVRFVLSRQGQEAVERDGKYLPLTAAVAKDQLEKLNGLGARTQKEN